MKVIKNVTLYKCDYCGKEYKRQHACITHEKRCSNNPINDRACFYCDNITKKEATIHFDDEFDSWTETKEILYCDKVKSYLYPPSVENKGNAFYQEDINDGDIPNKPMLKKCEFCPTFEELFRIK